MKQSPQLTWSQFLDQEINRAITQGKDFELTNITEKYGITRNLNRKKQRLAAINAYIQDNPDEYIPQAFSSNGNTFDFAEARYESETDEEDEIQEETTVTLAIDSSDGEYKAESEQELEVAQQPNGSSKETSGESDSAAWASESESDAPKSEAMAASESEAEKSDVLADHYSDDIQDIFKNVQINTQMQFESDMEDWGRVLFG